ncbi:hypothetical protein [Corynebacterium amycolatum]|uniref:hypothetical protein n=1 Tax=Corynebacterium amycolatum TaxID=43765 RepID=UPI0011C01ECA|nr:hypothetical protein [Corynebacterium amycolatum]
MDFGTVSSWVAAGISFASVGGAALWSWWNRPLVDWSFTGELSNPSRDGKRLIIYGSCGNFGDGNAHRVSVWIHRDAEYREQKIATSPLLRPGDSLEFETSLRFEDFCNAVVFVQWTPAPIRRRTERRSARFRVASEFEPTPFVDSLLRKHQSSQD